MARVLKRYLIVDAAGRVKAVIKPPYLRLDQLAIPVKITIPDSVWGQIHRPEQELSVPEMADTEPAIESAGLPFFGSVNPPPKGE